MKKIRYTTTEFYKNPSKAISFVNDGGKVYLAYKRMKDPIAVIMSYKDYKKKKKVDKVPKEVIEARKKFLKTMEKHMFVSKHWKSGLDLQKAVR
jgi:hypothetical protein